MDKLPALQRILTLITGSSERYKFTDLDQISGIKFPREYEQFVRSYGPGLFLPGECVIFNPFIIQEPTELSNYASLRGCIEHEDQYVNELSWKTTANPWVWKGTESDGAREKQFQYEYGELNLIPFATLWSGRIAWLPTGDPDSWPIVCTYESGAFDVFEISFLDFFISLAQNSLHFRVEQSFNHLEPNLFITYEQK
jgi:hypothetical protein